MLRRHRLAELLLVDVLKVPWAEVHEEACRLEHAISDNLEAHLVKLLGDPGACPHGNPIPGSANASDPGPLQQLSAVPDGVACVVRRIDEHLQTQVDHMRELEQGRLLPGQRRDGQRQRRAAGRSTSRASPCRSSARSRPGSTSASEGSRRRRR